MRYFLVSFFRQPGGQIDEQTRVVKRVRTSDVSMCNIILDYGLRKVDKCVVEGNRLDKTFDQLHDYYKKIYPSTIALLEKEGPGQVRSDKKV